MSVTSAGSGRPLPPQPVFFYIDRITAGQLPGAYHGWRAELRALERLADSQASVWGGR